MAGDFIVAIEIWQWGYAPSLRTDCQDSIGCCTNFYYWSWTLPEPRWHWYEHYDFWSSPFVGLDPDTIGVNIIRAFGTNQGPQLKPSTYDIWFGHVDVSYNGGTEVVQDSISFTNVGPTNIYITSVSTTAPGNFIFDPNEILGLILPGEEKWLHIQFTTDIDEPALTTGGLIVEYTAGSPIEILMSGQYCPYVSD